MGWLSFLFGKKAEKSARTVQKILKSTPDGSRLLAKRKLPTGRFCTDRHRPVGEWVGATLKIEVVGIQYRLNDVSDFVISAHRAEKGAMPYGLDLELEYLDGHDRPALKIFGIVGNERWHIGYVDKDTAHDLRHDLMDNGIPMAVELYNIWVSDTGFIDINMIILAPPGNSEKTRRKRRAKREEADPKSG